MRSGAEDAAVMLKAASKILAPVDLTAGSKVAVDCAVALAKTLHSTVTLFHVHEKPGSMGTIVPGADNALDAARERAEVMRKVEGLRAEFQRDEEVELFVAVQWGSPVAEIVAFAVGGDFDMIVMGTHGRTGVKRAVLGSVAEAVLRRAPCPVVTVHLPATDSWS